MSTEENKAQARGSYEAFNQRNWEDFYEQIADDYVFHIASMTGQGKDAYKQFLSMYLTAFPDVHLTIEDLIAEGDTVVVRHTFTGTHQGNFMGIAPTGKYVTVTAILIFRVANGKGIEIWINGDDLGVLQQLGVVPMPG
jgi:steroid delta-isomerase-like uncharacterized protein